MRVDAHHHFWTIGKYDYAWIGPEMTVLQKDYGPGELRPLLERNHIDRSVLVQTIGSLDETRWFLQLAGEQEFIDGVVGWVDLTEPAVGRTLDDIRRQTKLVGIRHLVHDEPDDEWLLRDDVQRGLGELERSALTYDLLVRPQHLAASLHVARKFERLALVVDHIAKPNIAGGEYARWARNIGELAKCPNVFCKLSGMVTEADADNWTPEDLKPYVQHVIEAFSPRRCMFGSDWPVCLLAASYEQVLEALLANIESLDDTEKDEVLGNTAVRFYGLPAS